MKAIKAFGPRDVRLVEVDRPTLGRGQVMVRVEACAICPTELHIYLDWDAGGKAPEGPLIMGHEFAGIVEEVADGVTAAQPGQRVAVEPSWHCGECDLCRAGRFNICRSIRFPSFPPLDGAMAEYIACPAFSVQPAPEAISPIEAALIEPLSVAVHAVGLARLDPVERVAIMGAGAIGLSVVQVARTQGTREVHVIEPHKGRQRLARELGASSVSDTVEELETSMGRKPTVVFEAAGHDGCVADAMVLADTGGRVYIIGIAFDDRQALSMRVGRRKELIVQFVRRSCNRLAQAVDLVVSGQVDLKCYPVLTFPPERATEAYQATIKRPGDMLRAAIIWSGGS